MNGRPVQPVAPLAGVATYEEAARVGWSVDESVRRLLRFHWVERRLAAIASAWIPATPEWEVKGALALHQWLDAEHAEVLRSRVAEMRHPAPRTDVEPDPALEAFLREVERPRDTLELLTGVHRVARHALVAAYRSYLDGANPLVDHPSRRIIGANLAEHADILQWADSALEALTQDDGSADRALAWEAHLRAYLEAAGGVAGGVAPQAAAPPPRAVGAFQPDTTPRRDMRFRGAHAFDYPPHVVITLRHVPAAERNLAQLCKRLLEMDVPEMMASFIAEDRLPWQHELAYRRQLWDEARHSMMGEVAFETAGVDWKAIPLNVGFSLRLNRHATPRERELVLYAIEQSLMPGDTGKRFEYETALESGDALSAHFHDYDWADEVLHAQIGRRWLREAGLLGPDVLERGRAVHDRTWRELERYRSPDAEDGPEWWFRFVREVLGRESAATAGELREPEPITE